MQKLIYNYPFGSPIPSRSFSASSYRYGFNGKEKDDEVKGGGNSQDYGLRIYDNRLGRFLSIDPLAKKYPELTTYQFASNTPIRATDLDGAEANFIFGITLNIRALIKRIKGERVQKIVAEVTSKVHEGTELGGGIEYNKEEKTIAVTTKISQDIQSSDADNNDAANIEVKTGVTKVKGGSFGFTNEGSGTKGGTIGTDVNGDPQAIPVYGADADIQKQESDSKEEKNWSVEDAKKFISDVKTNSQDSNVANKKQKEKQEAMKLTKDIKEGIKTIEELKNKPQ